MRDGLPIPTAFNSYRCECGERVVAGAQCSNCPAAPPSPRCSACGGAWGDGECSQCGNHCGPSLPVGKAIRHRGPLVIWENENGYAYAWGRIPAEDERGDVGGYATLTELLEALTNV